MKSHSKTERKALGAYYTPNNLSQVLCDWAIRSPDEFVLEPSFGGCGFLETSVETLKTLGCSLPESQLYGADIDKKAFDFLYSKLGRISDIKNHFVFKDFIQTTKRDFAVKKFDVAIGNPPYVSLHNMTEEQRESCKKVLDESPFADKKLGINASLWAFFLLHSLSFLRNGGRTAWVLPSSLLHADYAKALLKIHEAHFANVKVIKLNERFFQSLGADEVSVILLAEDFSENPIVGSQTQYAIAEDLNDLKKLAAVDTDNHIEYRDNYKHLLIPPAILTHLAEFNLRSSTQTVGEIAKVVIGMVTGDNSTFIINKQTAIELDISSDILRPVISRFSQLTGLIHTKGRHRRIVANNEKCLLVCPSNLREKNSPVRNYLATVSRKNRMSNKTFVKRENWYQPDDGKYPDAFLSYMTDKGPRLVINSAKINCTNSIHRLFFYNSVSYAEKKAIAASFLSSYSQLSAEIEGRSYGSGVLKIEPSAAKSISIFTSRRVLKQLAKVVTQIDTLIGKGFVKEAQSIVDEAICTAEGIPKDVFDEFNRYADVMRKDRYKGLRGS